MGQFWAVLLWIADRAGVLPTKSRFHRVANRRDGCTMVPVFKIKKGSNCLDMPGGQKVAGSPCRSTAATGPRRRNGGLRNRSTAKGTERGTEMRNHRLVKLLFAAAIATAAGLAVASVSVSASADFIFFHLPVCSQQA